jgi:arylsulfatase A-like enzyme
MIWSHVSGRTTIAMGMAVVSFALTLSSFAQDVKRPHIVLIVADDLGWNAVGYHGGFVKTPNIDRIAKQGVELDRFYVSPMCSPTRAGLMTGRYPMRFGMARSVVRPWAKFGLPPEERNLPKALAEVGYQHRGAFGKWHLGHLAPQWHPLAQGFTEYKGAYNGAADYLTRDRDGETDWHVNGDDVEEKGYTTDLIADAACTFISEHAKSGPMLCYVPFSAPHEPLQAPDKYIKRYANLDDNPNDDHPSDKRKLAAMVACMDDGIGRILGAIEKAGITKDTVVWFLSDNGGIGSIHGNNAPLRAAKLTVYEGGVRTPAAVWWPSVIEGGRKIETPIVNVDVMPTLVALAGGVVVAAANSDKPLDGVDVSGVLAGKESKIPPRDLYFFTGQTGLETEQIAVTSPEGWKLVIKGPDVRRPGGFRTPQHKVELFNLADDPIEKTDHAAEKPEIVAQLGAKAVAFRQSEPKHSLPPINRKPRDFHPPPRWHNAPAAATAPASGGSPYRK